MQTQKSKDANPATPPPAEKSDRWFALICAVLALGTFAIYWPVLHYSFVNFDDTTYVVKNPFVQHGVNWDAIKWAFTTGRECNWHPLTWISHMLDCQIYGLNHPGGHHFTSLLFHVANTLLLFAVWRRLTDKLWLSALVAALFAWHPLHVESVAWVAERKDVLSTFFFLLTLLAYARFVEAKRANAPGLIKWYGIALILFALGLMSKPMVVTLPFVLLLLDFWPLQRISWRAITFKPAHGFDPVATLKLLCEKIPFFLLSAAASVTTYLLQKTGTAMDTKLAFSSRYENAVIGYGWYLKKTFWPSELAVFYPHPATFSPATFLFVLLLLTIITTVMERMANSRPWAMTGWFWFAGMLVPVIGIVQVGMQSTADRYAYMPITGLFVMVVWGLDEILNHVPKFKNQLACLIAIPVLIACVAVSRSQVSYWQNSVTLFRRDVAVTTNNPVGLVNLGAAYDEAGKFDEAEAAFSLAAGNADSPHTLVSIGGHYAKRGDDTNAIKFYQLAIKQSPSYADAYYNLGNVLAREGHLEDAAREYTEALRISPHTADAENNLGAVLMRLGSYNDAVAHFNLALHLQPNFPEAEDQLGHVLLKLGRAAEALEHFQAAVILNPKFEDAQIETGLVLANQGKLTDALAPLEIAVKLDPANQQALFNLGALYEALGQLDRAAETFAEIVRLNPRETDAATRLAEIRAKIAQNKTGGPLH